jgi:probable HAF family extracellular repeat protein
MTLRRLWSPAVVLALALAGVLVPGSAQAATVPHYRAIDLGTLGGHFSEATAVNNRDQAVGWSDTAAGPTHPFLWSHGVLTDLGVLERGSGEYGVAFDVNEAGQVVGGSDVAGGTAMHAFLWRRGVMTDLGTLGGSFSVATAINNRGQVVGYSANRSGAWHGFLWERGTMTDLGVDNARGINDRGQVVGGTSFGTGFHAYLWQRGHVTDLGVLSGNYSEAYAVNNRGWVAGNGASPTGFVNAFLWRHGVMTRLLTRPGGSYSEARAINELGQVLGVGENLRPVIWQNGAAIDLTTRGIAADSTVRDINNRRHIAGTRIIRPGLEYHATLYA